MSGNSSDILPKSNDEYGTVEYWNERYSKETDDSDFDWFKSYADIADVIRNSIPDKDARILMLGCGNSKLSEEMYDDGFHNIVNIDYSNVVIERMTRRHKDERSTMTWRQMDVRQLEFKEETFDVAIDKGTMDAMMTSKGDVWDPPEKDVEDCTKEIDEVIRVLKKKSGVFLYITFGQPHFRKRFLNREGTSLEIRQLGDMFHYFAYVMKMT